MAASPNYRDIRRSVNASQQAPNEPRPEEGVYRRIDPSTVIDCTGNFLIVTVDAISPEEEYWQVIRLDVFAELFARLEHPDFMRDDWGGHLAEAPNRTAVGHARAILEKLQAMGFAPERLVASADGGAGFYFKAGNRYAIIECLNTGELMAAASDGSGSPRVWSFSDSDANISQTIGEIRGYLR